jgi:mono/diheme cytochrome c family protein
MLKVLKWIGVGLAGLVLIVVAAAAYVLIAGGSKASATVTVPADTVVVPTDSASLARGRHLVDAITKCADCHRDDFGGGVVIPEGPFMTLYAPNITTGRGGVVSGYTTADWVRALRHGVGRDGRKLAIMPAEAYTFLDEADLGALIAYMRSVAPVDREQPAKAYGPIARMLLVAGQFPLHVYDKIDHARNFREPRPAASDTAAYGLYLARIGGCPACHGDNMAGGVIPGAPPDALPAANLTPAGISHYSEQDFFRSLREGLRPGGATIDSLQMPWVRSGRMTDAEIHAVWTWLRSLPPAETPPLPPGR